jgi:hypothetical protein
MIIFQLGKIIFVGPRETRHYCLGERLKTLRPVPGSRVLGVSFPSRRAAHRVTDRNHTQVPGTVAIVSVCHHA